MTTKPAHTTAIASLGSWFTVSTIIDASPPSELRANIPNFQGTQNTASRSSVCVGHSERDP